MCEIVSFACNGRERTWKDRLIHEDGKNTNENKGKALLGNASFARVLSEDYFVRAVLSIMRRSSSQRSASSVWKKMRRDCVV